MSANVLSWALAQDASNRFRALADAYVTGALEVTHSDGRRVRYRSREEMMRIMVEGYEGTLSASSRRPAVTYARFSRGW